VSRNRVPLQQELRNEADYLITETRRRTLLAYDKAEEFRNIEIFTALCNELSPKLHDQTLAKILRGSSADSGSWLNSKPEFAKWLDPNNASVRCLWLRGIPGAGWFWPS
jgi:hypothetical protein